MTLVFIHAIGLDHECWQYLDRDLLEHSILIDLPGHGTRPLPPVPMGIPELADEVAGQLDGAFDIVGLSMGGAVAQQLALRHPSRVRSLVLAASTSGGRGGRSQLERAEITEKSGMPGILDDTLQRWFTAEALSDPEHPGVRYTRERLLSDDPIAFAAGWRALAVHDATARLPEIAVPTTVLHPEVDAAANLGIKQAMVAALPNGRLEIVPGPHMVQLEEPIEFGLALRRHLEWAECS